MVNVYIVDYYSLFKSNGLSAYVHQLVKYHSFQEIRYHRILLKCKPEYIEFTKKVENGITYLYIPDDINAPANSKTSFDISAADFIALDAKEKENIIFHFNWINHCAFAFLLKQRLDCVTLLTKHCIPWRDNITDDFQTFVMINRHLLNRSCARYLHPVLYREQLAYSYMDHILCVTRFAKDALLKIFGLPFSAISVIHNGLQPGKKNTKQKNRLKEKYRFSANEKLILFAGAVHQRKGVWELIKAFDRLSPKLNIRLIIAGNGQHTRIFETTKNNWSKITVTGVLDKKTLYDFYQMADIGVIPSYVEQCSYTCIEMMHFGLPIIVADVDGLAEIVPDDCGLKVPLVLGKTKAYIHQQKLADSILYFLDNPGIAKEYAARAKQHALKNFTAKKMVSETVMVYEKLIAEANTPGQALTPIKEVPLVSVLLPVYNGETYLEGCIDSILEQTYSNFELIIINDGSTDSTVKIVERYRDNRIILLNNDQHQGEIYCLNQGVKSAKGKYVTQIEADSIMHRERLQKQVAFLEDGKNKDIALVGCQHYIIDYGGKPVSLKQYPLTDAEIRATMLFKNPFSKTSVLVRSETLKKHKYTKKYELAADYQLWLKLLENNKGANINEFLSYKYLLPTSEQQRKELNEGTASLLSDQIEKCGVDYTVEELKIHIAVNGRYGKQFFNSPEKITATKNWVTKILTAQKEKNGYSNTFVNKMQRFIVEYYCDIY